jgi:hypothetical protein
MMIQMKVLMWNKSVSQFLLYHLKILLGNFTAKMVVRNGSLHEISTNNRFRTVNFAISKYVTDKCTVFSYCSIHKYT